jgi:predicted component of type VI protein secretion system
MLPKIHKINGNPDQIAACLESIIQETVEVKVEIGFCEVRDDLGLNTLANSRLGLDMIMGNKFLEESLQYAFLIGPLKHSSVSNYLEGGSHQALLKIFYDYFLPVEADGIMHLKLPDEAMINTLDQHTPPILGHSFLLVA